MKRAWLGIALASGALIVFASATAERLLGPWLWNLGFGLGHILAPVGDAAGETPRVDWDAVERDVAAADVPSDESGAPDGTKTKTKAKGKPGGGALFVSAEQVIRLSRQASVPASRYVPAQGQRPAGLQVAGVGGLGIGVRDGDVLTKVAGAEARSSAAVISTVLKLRAQKAKAISGEFWRGQERWTIVFEMPYLERKPPEGHSAPSSSAPDSSPPASSVPGSSPPGFKALGSGAAGSSAAGSNTPVSPPPPVPTAVR